MAVYLRSLPGTKLGPRIGPVRGTGLRNDDFQEEINLFKRICGNLTGVSGGQINGYVHNL